MDILSPREWYSVNRFIDELKQASSPVVSVYFRHTIHVEMIKLLQEIERKPEIKPIVNAIERRIKSGAIEKKLKSIHGIPPSAFCVFGWNDGQKIVIKEIGISKKLPPVYLVGRKAYIMPLHDILEIAHDLLLIILDHKTAVIKHYKGHGAVEEFRVKTYLKGKHSKGGWSQGRFARASKCRLTTSSKKLSLSLIVLILNKSICCF